MKKTVLLSAFLFTGLFAAAQSSAPDVLASGGGFATGTGFTNSFTVGQGSLCTTLSSASFILTQGFQQPFSIGTGIAPLDESMSVGTFPNPTNGPFMLEYDLESNAEVSVEVFDLLGQLVYTEITQRAPGHQLHPVNLGDQANGVYFIRCTIKSATGTSTLTSKVTLTR